MWEECTKKCVSKKHSDTIFSAIINYGCEFEEKVIQLLSTCFNVASNKDSSGRTALHIAASFGRIRILHWLLSHEAQINEKDEESGYSALHKAFYFGQLQASRLLLNNSASLFQILDNDLMSPFDHLVRDRFDLKKFDPILPCEVYVWGSNANYSLGLEKQQSLEFPELLDAFPKGSGGLKQVVMNKFHSVFVTSSGQAFSCGIGQGGKLGLGSEATIISPQKICLDYENNLSNKLKKSTAILQVAVGTYHTILLTEGGNVLSCGLNQYHQLGQTPPPMQMRIPKLVDSFQDRNKGVAIEGVSAGRFHSVFWCSGSVYTCGLNAGALGHLKGEKTVVIPKRIPSLSEDMQTITHVLASDGATAIATEKGNVYVLHEFQCRKIASKQLDLLKISMTGGKLDFVGDDLVVDTTPFQVVLLTKSGNIFIWSQTNPVLTRCVFRAGREFIMKDIFLCKNSTMALVSREGEVYVGTIKTGASVRKRLDPQSSSQQAISKEFPKRDQFVYINIQRVPGLYRATSVVCDPAGKNFAVTQIHPSALMEEAAKINPPPSQLKADLKKLLHDADSLDLIHDVVFHVGSRTFAAHRFILSSSCNAFYQEVCVSSSSFKNDNRTVHITEVPPEIFELLLEFIYTGTCALFETQVSNWNFTAALQAESPLKRDFSFAQMDEATDLRKRTSYDKCKKSEKVESSMSLVLREVQSHSKSLGIRKLADILEKAHIVNSSLVRNDHSTLQPKSLNRFTGKDFYDVKILSDDGKEFDAHRAVLTARSDYFRSMFGYVWIENIASKTVSLPVHSSVLEVILDYIYEDKAAKIEKSEDIDWIGNCLVVADLLLLSRLISICESVLVGLLTIKNVGKILEFSTIYNATKLKKSCMYFICYNLPAVVELRIWNCLSEEVMKDLTSFYQNFNLRIAQRLPTATSKEILDINAIMESLADVTLSSLNREREVKRKKPRRKSGKKSGEIKDVNNLQLLESAPTSTSTTKPIAATSGRKEDGWLKVDKPKRRIKSLSFEPVPKEKTTLSKSEVVDVSYSTPCKELNNSLNPQPKSVEESRCDVSFQENVSPVKQNKVTLFEMATVTQTANSPESHKCKKFPKLSQKQRRLQETHTTSVQPAVAPTVSPWKSLNTSVDLQDASQQIAINISRQNNLDASSNSPVKVHSAWDSPDKTNKNFSEAEVSFAEKLVPLQQIIAKERTQRHNFIKISTKPLKLTLLEDKAMEDLKKFYGIDNTDDEYIVVERVLPLAAAVPIWSKGKTALKSIAKSRSLSMSDSGI